jgi:hypothetical protein
VRLAEHVRRIHELIDRANERERTQPGVGDPLETGVDEAAGSEHAERPFVKEADGLVDPPSGAERVVQRRRSLKRLQESFLSSGYSVAASVSSSESPIATYESSSRKAAPSHLLYGA